MASQFVYNDAHFHYHQPAVVSFQSVWPCFPLTLPPELSPRHQCVAWDYTSRVEPSWGPHASFYPVNETTEITSNPKRGRKFFLDRSVFDLVEAHPYLSLTDTKLLSWYLCLTPDDRNIILDEGGFHQFLQRHPALEVSNHHVYVKYPVGKATPVLSMTSMSQKSESSSGSKTSKCASSNSSITQEPSHVRVFTERLFQADEEQLPWQKSDSVTVCTDSSTDLANFSLDVELERCVLVKQNKAGIAAKACPLHTKQLQQVKCPPVTEDKEGRRQDVTAHEKEEKEGDDTADESENFQSVLEDNLLVYLDAKGTKTLQTAITSDTVNSKTEAEEDTSESMKPGAVRRASETCDAMVGTTLTSSTTAFTQCENPETADKNVLTELYMSDLDEIAEEFIKMKKALEERRGEVKSTLRKKCDCLQRAQQAELHLLALQYNMCTQHCWRLYFTSAEGGLTSTLSGSAQHWLKEPPGNIGGVLQNLEADYNHMRAQILDGVPLQQLKPLCVDSEKISSGASYTPALMISDVVGNLPSRCRQEKTSGEDCGRGGDGMFLDSQTQRKKEKEEKMKSKRAATLIPQDRSAHQGAANKELNTNEAWYDAKEVLDSTGPAETQLDPATVTEAGTNTTESAVDKVNNSRSLLCVTNLTGHVTESEVMTWFEKYGASKVKMFVLNNDVRVAITMVSDLQSAEAAVKEMNDFSVDGRTLHVDIISGGGAAAGSSSSTSSQDDNTRRQMLTTEPRVSDRESKTASSREMMFPPPVSSGVNRRTVVSVTPTAQGTFVPQHFGTMGSFDYLMSELTRLHPRVDKQRFVDALVQLRARHRGVLCGLPLPKIREMASELLSGSTD